MRGRYIIIFVCFLPFAFLYGYQNPVNYIDSVDAVQANMGNQKFVEWITANDRDVDTLHSRVDSLGLEVDTLRLRVDSIQTSRDSIFFAYDAAGGLTIATGEGDTVDLDTEVREDGIFVHGADKAAVACNSAGWYKVDYSVGLLNATGANLGAVYSYLIKYSGSWSVVNGSYGYGTLSASTASYTSFATSLCIELVNGDSLAIIAFNGVSGDNADTAPHSVRLRIEKLH